ncbi:MAG: hypothetical protein LBN23_06590, partial [Paludibacter sp.]|nr:hypothetical protein [Paludibacter sp.]
GIDFKSKFGVESFISTEIIRKSVNDAHKIIDKVKDFEVDIFAILGMRNLSAFIGEIFVSTLAKNSNDLLVKNPHEDGYPDLLLLDEKGKLLWKNLENVLKSKQPFSPFENGGIEVKATCGSVPTPDICTKRGFEKPELGDTRIDCMVNYDWKAHHRETNNLIGLLWDFIEETPKIVAVFFSNDLKEEDWGSIVQPKKDGGRTTSVSIMTGTGIKKMYNGCVLVIDDKRYIDFFNRKNKSNLLK